MDRKNIPLDALSRMSSYQVINFSLGILLCLPSCTACTYSTVIISFLLGQPEAKKPAQLSSGM